MTPTIHRYAVMAATGDIGSQVAEGPLLALALAAALAFVLGCAHPAEMEADNTTTEARFAARDAAPLPPPRPRPSLHLSTLNRRAQFQFSAGGEEAPRRRGAFQYPLRDGCSLRLRPGSPAALL